MRCTEGICWLYEGAHAGSLECLQDVIDLSCKSIGLLVLAEDIVTFMARARSLRSFLAFNPLT